MRVKRTPAAAISVAALIGFAAALPAEANAATPPAPLHVSQVVASGFVGPLQFEVNGSQILVADSFTATLSRVGVSAPIATDHQDPDGDLSGVDYDRGKHSIAYATSNGDHTSTALHILQPGRAPVVADISGFEKAHNPDGVINYGIDNPSPCVQAAFAAQGIPASYPGILDSHPYAVASLGGGSWAVADAGANDVLKVGPAGNVSLLAVIPAVPVTITSQFAAASGLPACVVGLVYKFESVPTDVERGPDGSLYITSLPGGPEGPQGGNPGSLYKLDESHHLTQVATGFNGATNVAVDSHGGLFVAEISTGTISEVWNGGHQVVLSLPGVVGLEFANGHLYASTAPAAVGAQGPGSIVKLSS